MKAKSFKELFERARKTDEYWLESSVLDFTEDLFRLMKERQVSRSELARRIEASPAYVTKVLRGNANFTLASMVKLARAFDHEVRVHLGPAGTVTQWVDVPWTADVATAPPRFEAVTRIQSESTVFSQTSAPIRAGQLGKKGVQVTVSETVPISDDETAAAA
jgi:transcriptional regulator with XRE-family HTH domain